MSNQSDLPSIWNNKDLKEDIKNHEALSESKEINFKKCPHKYKMLTLKDNEIRCSCGNAWGGSRIHELWEAMKGKKQ